MKFKECSKCKLELPIGSFHLDNSKSSGVRSQCKKCTLIQKKKKHYYENIDVRKARLVKRRKIYHFKKRIENAIKIEATKQCLEKKLFTIAHYIIDNNATRLEVGKKFELSGGTMHQYMNVQLPEISLTLHRKVKQVAQHNKLVASIIGLEAIRRLRATKNNNIGG